MSDFLDCGNANITLEQALSAIMTKTSTGDIAVRTMIVEACATDAIDCSNNAIPLDQLLKSAIGIDAGCSKPALRLGLKREALANAIGAVSYADLTAANTALAAGVIFFNVALAKLDITTA